MRGESGVYRKGRFLAAAGATGRKPTAILSGCYATAVQYVPSSAARNLGRGAGDAPVERVSAIMRDEMR